MSRATIVFLCTALSACGSESGSASDVLGGTDSGGQADTDGSSANSGTDGSSAASDGDDAGSDGTSEESDDDSGDTGATGTEDPSKVMPAGIPMPSFGYLYETDLDATIYVDNTNPGCSNDGGSADTPLCDLFAGSNSTTFDAGDVVSILGGPYIIGNDKTLAFNGTEDNPVIVRAAGDTKVRFDAQGDRADFTYEGQFGIIEGIDFFHGTSHRVASQAHHLVFRSIEVHNPEGAFIDFNPVFNVSGHDILVYESMIYDNRRNNDTDSHGIQAGSGSSYVWILDNEMYNNNGDAFQGCHNCFDSPPHHVFIGRNVMHEDRENGVDLKTIHDVVVSENLMYGYTSSETSNGDAMVIGSNGYDESTGQGPRRVWVLNNEFRDSATGIRIEGVEDVWVLGNVFTSLRQGLQVDNKQYQNIVITSNTMDNVEAGIYSWNNSCSADSVTIANNLISNVSGRHLELPDCDNLTLANNLFWEAMSVRIGNQTFDSAVALDAEAYASNDLDANPEFMNDSLVPGATSPALDGGAAIEALLAELEDAYGGDAHCDLAGQPRPAGASADIGAYEQ